MRIARTPECHPNKKHEAKGYCKHCYERKVRKYRSPSTGKSRSPEALRRRRFRHQLKPKYGINFKQYTEILIAQSGRCAICEQNFPGLEIDHSHRGSCRVRGLLCPFCNRAVAHVENYPQEPILSKVLKYLAV